MNRTVFQASGEDLLFNLGPSDTIPDPNKFITAATKELNCVLFGLLAGRDKPFTIWATDFSGGDFHYFLLICAAILTDNPFYTKLVINE